eukprot:7385793-Prorocentrum_lima.AAC.1
MLQRSGTVCSSRCCSFIPAAVCGVCASCVHQQPLRSPPQAAVSVAMREDVKRMRERSKHCLLYTSPSPRDSTSS